MGNDKVRVYRMYTNALSASTTRLKYVAKVLSLAIATFFPVTLQAQSVITDWTAGTSTSATGVLGSRNLTVTTQAHLNSGLVFNGPWSTVLPASFLPAQGVEALALGYIDTGATQTVTFNVAASNPVFMFNYIEDNATFSFAAGLAFTIESFGVGASVTRAGNTITYTNNRQPDAETAGFIIRFTQQISTVSFDMRAPLNGGDSVGFSVALAAEIVTPSPGLNGSMSPAGATNVVIGDTIEFTVLPDPGYSIGSVTGCAGNLDGSKYTTGAISASCTVTSTFTDTAAPTLSSSSPTDDATGVAVGSNIVLTFSEAVDAETGNIVLKKASDGSMIETFDVTSAITGSGTTTITINPTADLASSTAYYVEIASTAFDNAAGNSYAGIADATTLNFETAAPTNSAPAPTPASEFAEHEAEIRNMLVDDASRSLRSSVAANRRMVQGARKRFAGAQGQAAGCLNTDDGRISDDEFCSEIAANSRNVPFDVTGNFTLSETGLSTAGNFFQQVGNEEGTYRRLFFGDFDVQHDNDTDSTTATLTGRMAGEHMTSEQTMLGYFIGGELATSTIGGSFEGEQDRIGVTAGGYVVHELSELVYFDGFASVGAGRNNLDMANDTLALESQYTTQTATLGGAITGVYSQKGYDFKPELAFSYGKTWLGGIGFTGRAYGLTDNTLSLDAGTVSIISLTFRPEVIVSIGADFVADSNTHFTYAPRLICEQIKSTTKTSDCGTGGELGFSSTSEDGLSSADMRVLLDRINGGTRSSFVFSVEHKF